jgi:hypothetical protein
MWRTARRILALEDEGGTTMATDVKLDQVDGSFLVLEGRVVQATATDFMLDSPERRRAANPFRRALVHDQGDGLTVNFANDYKGGVTLNAVREITPHRSPNDGAFIKIDPTPILVVRGGIEFEVHTQSPVLVGGGGELTVTKFSLSGELAKLQRQISALQARVVALEAKK